MSKDCKPFQRIASAILFSKVLDEFEILKKQREVIFNTFLSSYIDDYSILKQYVDENFNGADDNIIDAILTLAEEKDLFDKLHWDVYLRLKTAVKKFEFFTCLKQPNSWDKEEAKKYNRLITQMLLFQKKYYDLEGYEIVKKSDTLPLVEVVEEEEEMADIEF